MEAKTEQAPAAETPAKPAEGAVTAPAAAPAAEKGHAATAEVPAGGHGESPQLMNVAPTLVGLTWVTFILMTVVLYKVAWKPILAALQSREDSIRKSLEDAEKARRELAEAETRRKEMLADADKRGREIVELARSSANDLAAMIDKKARDEARVLIEDARREINDAAEKARFMLRRESADLAIQLAEKILKENLTAAKNKDMIERLLKDVGNAN